MITDADVVSKLMYDIDNSTLQLYPQESGGLS